MVSLPVIALRLLDGRVGSTLLMQLLGTSDEVIFERRYPEGEFRYLSYCMRAAEWVATPWDPSVHPGVTELLFGPSDLGGPIPFAPSLVNIDQLAPSLLAHMWKALSDQLLRSAPNGRYYAEKIVGEGRLLLDSAIPVRLIDLVRDPRDIFCSVRARTGAGPGFGRHDQQSDDDFLEQMVSVHRQRLGAMAATPDRVDRMVIRYEDLVADLSAFAVTLSSWLGLQLDARVLEDSPEQNRHHMTSPSAAASVGRWRHELSARQAERIWEVLGVQLEAWGYGSE